MKTNGQQKISKGDRFNWKLLKDIKPIKLIPENIKGDKLNSDDLKKICGAQTINYII
jgi:hypothetical protein